MFLLVAGVNIIDPAQGGGLLLTLILTAVLYWVVLRIIGASSLWDFLRLILGSVVTAVAIWVVGMESILAAVILGYLVGAIVDMLLPPVEKKKKRPVIVSSWVMRLMLIALPFLIFLVLGELLGRGSIVANDIVPLTDPRRWGGLLLTMMLTVVGIIGSFPIGVLLALGRRSNLPVVKLVCTLYIELVRGVPFISVLFMGALLLPLANSALSEVPGAYRAMVATIIFSAAYLAENVRGGLQSIPPGQEEAAKAIGLNGLQTIMFITLPQALRAVIPALVGMFIGLFKDTSLVAIVGLIDLTGISNSVVAQTEFLGFRREVFLFISIIYFVFSYVMSYISRRIEASGAGAAMAKRI
ncbi:MAG: amino acid ABC transporter permease [Anaerolineaceae bacterium]|nr:amino acid ABC transporter permease [Anaerolineaceae bacterium]